MTDEVDELRALPPEEFVSARNALAKQLKAEGRTELAAEVRSLRKPTVSQWIADQVRRHDEGVVDELRATSRGVAAAQEAVMAGGERDVLREATAKRREALSAVGQAVQRVLLASGRPAQHGDEVLRAIDAEVTAEVSSGSFGLRDDLELPEPPEKAPVRDRAAERRAAEAQAALETAEARVDRARHDLEEAESALEGVRERYRRESASPDLSTS